MPQPTTTVEVQIPSAADANLDAILPDKLDPVDEFIAVILGAVNRLSTVTSATGKFDKLMLARQMIRELTDEKIGTLTQVRQRCDQVIGQALDTRGAKGVTWSGYLVSRRTAGKPRPTLDKVKLLQAGVLPQQIEAATVYGEPGKPGVTVRKLKEGGQVQEDDGSWGYV